MVKCEDALVRTTTVRIGCPVTVLVGVQVFLGKPDRKGGMTVCWVGNVYSVKDVEETALLKEQFGGLTACGTWE